jgi:3-methyladenine DNA glycosylase Tag
MTQPVFQEHGEFVSWSWVEVPEDDGWKGVTWFERAADRGKESIPSMKHTIKQTFRSEHEAIQAALANAVAIVRDHRVGFE